MATPATTDSSTLYFGPWYRRSPFFEKTLEAGCSAYDIYNHMYLPGYYGDPVEEYWALLNGVTLWDVSVERIVEITGADASAFVNTLTCRDLTKCAVGQGKYVLITAEDGGIVNDPVLLRVDADRWWLALADSDAGLWARGVAIHSGMDVKVREPEIYPVQVQGPKSKDVMAALFGPQIHDIRYYWTLQTELDGIPVVISRTGWTGEVGYEVYLRDPSRGAELWDRIMEAGRPHDIRPIAPCEARRIEAGIFNYGSDMTIENNPFEIMGLERLVEPQAADYIGKAALEEIRARGVDRKLVGIEVDGDALPFELSRKCVARHDGEAVGTVTDLIWSPRLERNIGYVWVPIGLAAAGHAARDRGARRRALAGADGRHPVHRPEEGRPQVMTDTSILTAEEIASVRRGYRAASLLPKRAYHDPAIHEWERANILRRDWVMVAREEDIPEPGSYLLANSTASRSSSSAAGTTRCAPSTTCAVIAAPRWPRRTAARPSASSAHTTPGSTTSMARSSGRSTPRTSRTSRSRTSASAAVRVDTWQGFVFLNLDPDAVPLAGGSATSPRTSPGSTSARFDRPSGSSTTWPRTGSSSPRTTASATTARVSIRSSIT